MEKSIIIIGAGIAGLSAGCYARMNGYKTTIFEMDNARAGGLCTSWNRKGYMINGCIRFLLGSRPENGFYNVWEELGAIQDQQMIELDEFIRVEDEQGKVFILYTDVDRLEQHMKEIAPEDTKVIEEFTKGIRSCLTYAVLVEKAPEVYGLTDFVKLSFKILPFFPLMMKWRNVSVVSFAERFKNPLLRESLTEIIGGKVAGGGFLDIPMIGGLQQFAWFHNRVAAYPQGGSSNITHAIEKRYRDLGGEINYKSRVDKILVENDKAVGIRLTEGTEHRGDVVISAADGYTTIFNMLEGKYADNKISNLYEQLPLFPPVIHIAIGVSRTFDEIPSSIEGINFPLLRPITIDNQEINRLTVQIYNFDATLAPTGKTVMRIQLLSDFERWRKLKQDNDKYKAEKDRIAGEVIAALDQRFPGLAGQVEMCDIATPVTYERYTGNRMGSTQGWLITPKTMRMGIKKILPGLENFYMAGQWVEIGGGLPAVAMSGRNVIQIICKQDKKNFITNVPK